MPNSIRLEPLSKDEELDIKRRMLERLTKESTRPSLLKKGIVNVLTDENLNEALASTHRPLLVDFWALWCGPCKMMAPIVEELARDYAGRADFAKLNTDENQASASRFGVMSIPSFIVFSDGHPVERVVGAVGRQGLEAVLLRHLST